MIWECYLIYGIISMIFLGYCSEEKMEIVDYLTLLFVGPIIMTSIIFWMLVDFCTSWKTEK